ncbi:PTB domain-containing engulfment adapter protein 1 isoform X6 [Siniperca chuatsi]|uniref:PTB domain-containing engulfment adapter protein 1 isoform X6 n=1 Tax=Siniperca chuatsi TaxID=119488 RepID=UPI001CE06925|nr:PTB domain-containing engulfment adapter protein 1 isoform X6 [Siniperca chuatsi]
MYYSSCDQRALPVATERWLTSANFSSSWTGERRRRGNATAGCGAVSGAPRTGGLFFFLRDCSDFCLLQCGILADTQEGPRRRTFSTMNRAFNRKKDKSWMHTPEALAKHYIPYNVKFLGNTEVEAPKGTEVVKDAVRKLKFQRHIKKSEGQKTPKVELQISIYGVKILDLKTKDVQHNCQLHRISFCADDKTDKRIFTFICKDSESNKHLCYVFDSEKCAEEITLTIGQAFDLAYKKFLESGGKDVETRKQIGSLQKRIQELETENSELKKQLQDLEEQLMIAHVPPAGSISMKPQSTDVFDMVPFSPVTPLVPTMASNGCPPPPPTTLPPDIRKDLFGAEPFDPFTCGAADFPPDIQSKLDEMQEGFKMGLTLEGTVFSLDPLDSRC